MFLFLDLIVHMAETHRDGSKVSYSCSSFSFVQIFERHRNISKVNDSTLSGISKHERLDESYLIAFLLGCIIWLFVLVRVVV